MKTFTTVEGKQSIVEHACDLAELLEKEMEKRNGK